MVITKIKIVVQRWGKVTIIVVEIDRVVYTTNLSSDVGTI